MTKEIKPLSVEELKPLVRRLYLLFEDPQVGLISWNMMACELIDEIAKGCGYVERKPDHEHRN